MWFNLDDKAYVELYPALNNLKYIRSLCWFDHKMWIGTRNDGLFTYEIQTKTLEKLNIDDRKETLVCGLEAIGEKLYIASYEFLSIYDSTSGKREIIGFPDGKNLNVISIFKDLKNKFLWIGTESYLYKYNLTTNLMEPDPILAGNTFKTLVQDSKGNILAGTDAGLYVIDSLSNKFEYILHDVRNSNSLCNNVIRKIFCDKDDNIWIGTNRGLSLSQTSLIYRFIHLSEVTQQGEGNLFSDLYIDSQKRYWLAGENGIISIQEVSNKEFQVKWFNLNNALNPLNHNLIHCIYEDREGDIWIATDGGFARFDSDKQNFQFFTIYNKEQTHNANWAYSIYEDENGKLWLGTYLGGLFIIDKKELITTDNKKTFYDSDYNYKLSEDLDYIIYQIVDGGDDLLWANTQKGLVSIHKTTLKVTVPEIYLDNMLYDNQLIWYSTYGKLFCYDTVNDSNTEIIFSESNKHIHGFVKENDRVWFSSTNGIYYVDITTFKVYNVSKSDFYYQSGFYNSTANEIIWGGEDGFACFSLNKLNNKHTNDFVEITSALISGNNVNNKHQSAINQHLRNKEIKVKQGNNIALKLSSYSYSQQNEEIFYYKINDNGKWNHLERGQNHINFANLSGGIYTLYLCNSDPEETDDVVLNRYTLNVAFPWYATTIANILYAVLVVLLILSLIKYLQIRNRRLFERKEKEKTLELSNLKMDFFVNISHELKTPLSMIIAPLSKLIAESNSSKQKTSLISIHENSLRLNTLIHKILDFKQIEHENENALIRSHVELNTLLNNTLKSFNEVINDKKIEVTLIPENEPIWLYLDILKIESIFINLLSNAIKYIPKENGKITISIKTELTNVVITIADNGSGIKDTELPFVFMRYFQGQNKKKHTEGTGIGLYLVKKFTELHDGTIKIRNHNGIIAEVTLPMSGDNLLNNSDSNDIIIDNIANADKPTLLLIDDNKEIIAFLSETLSHRYRCITAFDGKDGLTSVQKYNPDLIIVDQMMPVMNGFEFCKAIRQNQVYSAKPIIMLTAKDDMSTELESIKLGIDAFMSKPFDVNKIILRVEQLLYKKETLEKHIRIEALTQPNFEQTDKRSNDEILMEKITKIIEDNMDKEEFNVAMLADMIHLDQKQLYRKMKQLINMTPINLLKKLRMKKAAVLLAQNKFTVSEVMYLVGYTNASYFSKCFTEEFGKTPKQFIICDK